jgi:hypothetical protein
VPANAISLHLTDAYRDQLAGIRKPTLALAQSAWRRVRIEELEQTYAAWLALVAAATTGAQANAVRASASYLTAFLASETRKPQPVPVIDAGDYVGVSRDGRAIRDALASPLIGVKVALRDQRGTTFALNAGKLRALRMVGLDIDQAARKSLQAAMVEDDRITGYQRAVKGTCGACLGAAVGPEDADSDFEIHPNCQCVPEPRVRGARDRFPRPTGQDIFEAMTPAEQIAALGPEIAELVRSGAVPLSALVGKSPQATDTDFITQAAATDLPRRRRKGTA